MTLTTFLGSVEDGLMYALLTLGIYLSYRILDVADLTVDGSFTLGAAVSVMCSLMGHPILGLLLGAVAGSLAGLVTALLQTKLKVQPILAGILTMTGLYTINIWVMGGKPNVSLMNTDTFFTPFIEAFGNKLGGLIAVMAIVLLIVVASVLLLHTPMGLAIRATGDNEAMVRASSINVDFMKIIGLMTANALVGMSGALMGQNQRFADANMGVGMVVMGLASLIIGELICVNIGEWLLGRTSIVLHMCGVLLGSVLYRLIIAQALELDFSAGSMKLVSALIITGAIAYPEVKQRVTLMVRMQKHKHTHEQAQRKGVSQC